MDPIELLDQPGYQRHHRLCNWTDVNASDIKIFLAHVIVMGLVRKSTISKYWRRNSFGSTPFFGIHLTRPQFERLLVNLHVNDNTRANTDPLYKIRPVVDMVDRNFLHVYTPKKNISVDEAACPFKGRLGFKMYNPRKPARFHIRLYQACEAESGYCMGLEIFTGNKNSECIKISKPIDPGCNTTTKLVLGLLQKSKLLDLGYHIYMDNYYTSPELLQELYLRSTYAAGTCRSNRKGLPRAVVDAKLKPGEICYRRADELLAIKWCDKRAVLILSTIHEAVEIPTGKKDRFDQPIIKPEAVHEYTKNMRGCDLADQLINSYCMLRRTCKWWRKIFFHFFAACINNAYIIYKKYVRNPVSHDRFMEILAEKLIESSKDSCTLKVSRTRSPVVLDDSIHLQGRHFPSHIGKESTRSGSKLCKVCNFGKKSIKEKGFDGIALS